MVWLSEICRGDDFTCGDQVREACLEEERRCRCEKYSWHGSSSRLFSETFESLAAGDLALEDWLRENSELFPCCLNCQEAEEQFETLVNSVGLALVIFGITGVLVFSILLLLPRRIPRLTPADLRYFEAPELLAKRDGAELHEKIPRHMWCVSLEDVRQFRRLVMHAVARGQIQPTENDNFEASDLVIGPSVYTVTEQFVKPLTAAAGKMSWALLRNPEGLRCDLFVTHAWAEGVYEFIDKVERSWPRGAKAAYVCFLSNPQNLDISSLLTSPSASPFALALESASTMLVIPNERVSLYTRLWCVYEAYLAFTCSKNIRTAEGLRGEERLCIMRIGCWFIAALGGLMLLRIRGIYVTDELRMLTYLVIVCFFVALSPPRLSEPVKKLSVVLCCLLMAESSWLPFIGTYPWPPWGSMFYTLCILVACCCVEFDRLRTSDAFHRSRLLRKGYSGKLTDAQCSSSADKEKIYQEILDSGKGKEVEDAVNALLRMNVVTPELLKTLSLAGQLGDVSYARWSLSALGTFQWAFSPVILTLMSDDEEFSMVHGILLVQVTLWLAMFACFPPERKTFASTTMSLWLFVIPFIGSMQLADLALLSACVGPVFLVVSLAGPGRVAEAPCLGVVLVQFLVGDWYACFRRLKPKSPSPSGETSVAGEPDKSARATWKVGDPNEEPRLSL
ncbi:unnamed protein product [Effrenium voratum]|nr:unnamed protein product [Effrenium voratum]